MWKLNAQRAGKPPADGTEVFVLGRPAIYEAKGEFQLVITRMLPTAAVGAAQQELERIKLLLQKDGLFDPARKRPLPPYAGDGRRRNQRGRRRASRHHHREPEALAVLPESSSSTLASRARARSMSSAERFVSSIGSPA